MKLNVVLLEPEIPQNTGNISRTCAATGSSLHMIKPFGFEISDKHLKRAGLDYWQYLDVHYYENWQDFLSKNAGKGNFYFMSTKGQKVYSDQSFVDGDYLIFGRESHGLPEPLLKENYSNTLRIPMLGNLRSLNLSNSVALTVYEALRQNDFEGLNEIGHLTGRPN
ncbi:MAG: tRNA (uridine(34)/cytosine(34)/5-carboxymethylaminomethyluridine(34)-2'-O)-methyltransferase TrmL [Clostridia bacterium]|nr:tRNA (uridine(34)/cytosine(34)/5-carboxymethylaminomethyluridine(34)-2'-O)-methyltransferase TrmL [Clostridia bacterium]